MQESLCQWCNKKKPTAPCDMRMLPTSPINGNRDFYYYLCDDCMQKVNKNRSDELMRVQIANGTINNENKVKTMQRLMTERTKE